jgi:hypothetical protein
MRSVDGYFRCQATNESKRPVLALSARFRLESHRAHYVPIHAEERHVLHGAKGPNPSGLFDYMPILEHSQAYK